MPLFYPYKDDINHNEEVFYVGNFKPQLEKKNGFIPYDLQSPLIKSQLSRRDTQFLRFGRKR